MADPSDRRSKAARGRFRPQLPRPTLRLRLTLLYGSLFLLSGTVLLAIDYVLAEFRFPLETRLPPGARQLPGGLQQVMALGAALAARKRSEAMHALLVQYGIVLAAMTVLSIGLGWLVAGRVLRPLRTITTVARNISANNLHERLALSGPEDELKELADTFDGLLGRLERAFAAQRRFVANASHELRTPLARQRTVIEVALGDPDPSLASLSKACKRALAASEQQERLIEALLTLAKSQSELAVRSTVDLAAVARDVVESRAADAHRQGIELSVRLDPAPMVGDARLAERLAANLVSNALRHNVHGGWAQIATGVNADHAVLLVANSGPVVPPSEVDRLYEPFQRLDTGRIVSRDSLGLGLSIVKAIADAHSAWINTHALPGGGLEIEIHFPSVPRGLPENILPAGASIGISSSGTGMALAEGTHAKDS